ncbi:MAG TPA: hypothetical protein VFT55_05265 [Planctomycetota bacterium]|nr:hypothetical protein [Planctomycetota bacterium]
MRWHRVRNGLAVSFCWPFSWLLALAACSAAAPVPESLQSLLGDSPDGNGARLSIGGNRIVAAAVAIGNASLPKAARTAIEAIAPQGELLFLGREWGPRGAGFRVEKRYREGAKEHVRSVLVDADGRVLEREHSVAIAEVPQHVLVAAMRAGPVIDEARIVSGPEREEFWSVSVRDRLGRTFVARVSLEGTLLDSVRRVSARVDS